MKAIREMKPGKVAKFGVVRVMDDFVVDLMKSACAIEYFLREWFRARGEQPAD